MTRALFIAPHPDDEVLGCGATIAKYVSLGYEVLIIIATNANEGAPELYDKKSISNVRREALKSHKILGVIKTIFFDFPAPSLDHFPSYKIALKISEVISQFRPNEMFIPHPGDIHIDHVKIYQASLVAARPVNTYYIKNIYSYETLSETEWSPISNNKTFIPNHFINVSGKPFEKKIEALKCFHSQMKKFPHPRSIKAIKALSNFRGATVGVERAEAFQVERQIIL